MGLEELDVLPITGLLVSKTLLYSFRDLDEIIVVFPILIRNSLKHYQEIAL